MQRFVSALSRDLNRVYVATLFFCLHYVLMLYFNSTFITSMVGEAWVGIVYAVGAIVTLIMLSHAPHTLRIHGNKHVMLSLIVLEATAITTFAFVPSVPLAVIAFIFHHGLATFIFMSFDVFIEHYAKRQDTGQARGIFLTIINVCYVISPFLSGLIITELGFSALYGISLIMLIPFALAVASIRHFRDEHYEEHSIIDALQTIRHIPRIRGIVMINLILQIFYASMVVYMPIYLIELGYTAESIGVIFTVMLLPFVLFQYALGRLADKVTGEKEFLVMGLLIIAVTTTLVPLIGAATMTIWAILLFGTRIGASWTEIMGESYFYKQVRRQDADLLALWRGLNGFAYIIVPMFAFVALKFFSISAIFFMTATLAIVGIGISLQLRDTR